MALFFPAEEILALGRTRVVLVATDNEIWVAGKQGAKVHALGWEPTAGGQQRVTWREHLSLKGLKEALRSALYLEVRCDPQGSLVRARGADPLDIG